MQSLTATEIKKATAAERSKKLSDGGGLYLLINPNDTRYWRYDYRYAGKRKTLALGVYPELSLKQARERHLEARERLGQDIDPGEEKRFRS